MSRYIYNNTPSKLTIRTIGNGLLVNEIYIDCNTGSNILLGINNLIMLSIVINKQVYATRISGAQYPYASLNVVFNNAIYNCSTFNHNVDPSTDPSIVNISSTPINIIPTLRIANYTGTLLTIEGKLFTATSNSDIASSSTSDITVASSSTEQLAFGRINLDCEQEIPLYVKSSKVKLIADGVSITILTSDYFDRTIAVGTDNYYTCNGSIIIPPIQAALVLIGVPEQSTNSDGSTNTTNTSTSDTSDTSHALLILLIMLIVVLIVIGVFVYLVKTGKLNLQST